MFLYRFFFSWWFRGIRFLSLSPAFFFFFFFLLHSISSRAAAGSGYFVAEVDGVGDEGSGGNHIGWCFRIIGIYYITCTLQQENLCVGLKKPNANWTNTITGMQALQFTHKMEFQNLTSGQNFFGVLVLHTCQNDVSSEGPNIW